jgi:hypothetical protein
LRELLTCREFIVECAYTWFPSCAFYGDYLLVGQDRHDSEVKVGIDSHVRLDSQVKVGGLRVEN